jgi:hypothetical protein
MKSFSAKLVLGLVLLPVFSCSTLLPASPPQQTFAPPTIDVAPLPPGGVPESFQDVPIMPGADLGITAGTSYTYQVDAAVMDVLEFYLREMPRAGWTETDQTGDPAIGEAAIRLSYRMGERTATVFIVAGESGPTAVTILVSGG